MGPEGTDAIAGKTGWSGSTGAAGSSSREPTGTTARSLLGRDLPQIADDVTAEHLLTHTSGIGDHLDEEADTEITDYVIGAAHELTSAEAFLSLLDGHATKFAAGERFSHCDGGFVVLALLAERAGGIGYHDLVRERVLLPAGMTSTEFLPAGELPAHATTCPRSRCATASASGCTRARTPCS
ncbi:serine hydrolase domain-containing protein [Streptomyces sp. NPDC059171]|uniref:serine hydrolase domain-containing protein n=1 Tax=Streptomyces sp. NPDC059171 TaxID=3346755 RepID=UPI00369FFE50